MTTIDNFIHIMNALLIPWRVNVYDSDSEVVMRFNYDDDADHFYRLVHEYREEPVTHMHMDDDGMAVAFVDYIDPDDLND